MYASCLYTVKKYAFAISIMVCLFTPIMSGAQKISGRMSLLIGQTLQLEGFDGFKQYLIDSAVTDGQGHFTLHYRPSDYGVGRLRVKSLNPFFVLLTGEDIVLEGLSLDNDIEIKKGYENSCFEQYAREHPVRQQALSAWYFLDKLYSRNPLFDGQHRAGGFIRNELSRISIEDSLFIRQLPESSYVRWYLATRKMLGFLTTVAQYRSEEIQDLVTAFRKIDYTDRRLYKSGLLQDAVEGHLMLLENSGKSLEALYKEMQSSIDFMIDNLKKDDAKLNEVAKHLFEYLERKSLFRVSEYLSLKVLNLENCTLNNDLEKQMENYRAMKKGNIAPDIEFTGELNFPGSNQNNIPAKLSAINSQYVVVLFGASWCPKCIEDIPEISRLYSKWKKYGVEVVLVSLDEEQQAFRNFTKSLPFISTCDFKKWEGESVRQYHVFATPTIYLLDNKRKILLRPNSVMQLDSWVDWYLVNGNK